jgi:hypothetical protein
MSQCEPIEVVRFFSTALCSLPALLYYSVKVALHCMREEEAEESVESRVEYAGQLRLIHVLLECIAFLTALSTVCLCITTYNVTTTRLIIN